MNSLLHLAFSTRLVQHTDATVGPGVPEVVILNQWKLLYYTVSVVYTSFETAK